MVYFDLRPTVVADAVALVGEKASECRIRPSQTRAVLSPPGSAPLTDRFIVAYFGRMTCSRLQLVFITATYTAARVAGAGPKLLAALYRLGADYPERSIEEMEAAIAALLAETDAVGQAQPILLHRTFLPATPPGILSRLGLDPSGSVALRVPPDIEVVIQTTPTAFAGHLVGLLPVAWIHQVTAPMHEALLIAMTASGTGRLEPCVLSHPTTNNPCPSPAARHFAPLQPRDNCNGIDNPRTPGRRPSRPPHCNGLALSRRAVVACRPRVAPLLRREPAATCRAGLRARITGAPPVPKRRPRRPPRCCPFSGDRACTADST